MTIEVAAKELKVSNLSSKQKKKVSRMEEKIKTLTGERKEHEQREKKLSFKLKKISREREILLGKIGEKNSEVKELSVSKNKCGENILENEKPFKKLLATFTFKSKELEERNSSLRSEISEIEQKVERISHFIDKHQKKEERLTREIDDISKELEVLLAEKRGIEGNIREAEKSLKEIAAY